jgi:hypothetical protein
MHSKTRMPLLAGPAIDLLNLPETFNNQVV